MTDLAPSVEQLMAKSRELATKHGQSVEAMIRVFLDVTGTRVEDAELVTTTEYTGTGVTQRTRVRRRGS